MIKFENTRINYGDFVALKDINLTINEGEFFTLLGPSGCGKTTTLRGLVGLNKLSGGDIFIHDKSMKDEPIEKRGIGVVFQNYALFPTMSVFDNIAYGLKVRKEDKASIKAKVEEACIMVELDDHHLNKNISELSGGQQQRVAIARSLVLKPEILVLDEPLSNLDAALRSQLRVELKLLQKNLNITTVYVTHDQEEALTLSDRIAVFNKGAIEQVGTSQEIYNEPATEFVANFIGQINILTPSMVKDSDKKYMIRPENISISKEAGKHQGVIKNVDFTGFYTTIHIDFEDGIFKVIEMKQSNVYEVGDSVYIDYDEGDLLCY